MKQRLISSKTISILFITVFAFALNGCIETAFFTASNADVPNFNHLTSTPLLNHHPITVGAMKPSSTLEIYTDLNDEGVLQVWDGSTYIAVAADTAAVKTAALRHLEFRPQVDMSKVEVDFRFDDSGQRPVLLITLDDVMDTYHHGNGTVHEVKILALDGDTPSYRTYDVSEINLIDGLDRTFYVRQGVESDSTNPIITDTNEPSAEVSPGFDPTITVNETLGKIIAFVIVNPDLDTTTANLEVLPVHYEITYNSTTEESTYKFLMDIITGLNYEYEYEQTYALFVASEFDTYQQITIGDNALPVAGIQALTQDLSGNKITSTVTGMTSSIDLGRYDKDGYGTGIKGFVFDWTIEEEE